MSENASDCGSYVSEDDSIKPSAVLFEWKNCASSHRSSIGASSSSIRTPHERVEWPAARELAQLVYFNNMLFLHGGQSTLDEETEETEHYSDLWEYSLVSRCWRQLPASNVARMAHSLSVVELNDRAHLLVFGGYDPAGLKPEFYDVTGAKWYSEIKVVERVERLVNVNRKALDSLENTEVLVGDAKPQHLVKTFEHYENNSTTNRYLHSSVSVKLRRSNVCSIFIFGGINDQGGVALADLTVAEVKQAPSSSSRWELELHRPQCGGEAPSARYGHRACTLGADAMLIYGGSNDNVKSNTDDFWDVFRLDYTTMMWTIIEVAAAPYSRVLFSMVPDRTNSRIFVFGGVNNEEEDDDEEENFRGNRGTEAYIGHITADIDPTNESLLRHQIQWRRADSHHGSYPKDHSHVAFCTVPSLACDEEDAEAHPIGLRCFLFGGQTAADSVCVNTLTELTVLAEDLNADDESVNDAEDGYSEDEVASFHRHEDEGAPCQATDRLLRIGTETSSDASGEMAPDEALPLSSSPQRATTSPTAIRGRDDRGLGYSEGTEGSLGSTTTSACPRNRIEMSTRPGRGEAVAVSSLSSTDADPTKLLVAMGAYLQVMNATMQDGMRDIKERLDATNRRIDSMEARVLRHGVISPEQHLINEQLKMSVHSLQKSLGLL